MRLFIICEFIVATHSSSLEPDTASSRRSSPVVVGSAFSSWNKPGDFAWMIEQPDYVKTLFVFNDNEEQFFAYLAGDKVSGCSVGGGNAVIRPYQCREPPRAVGIPTGSRGVGYATLDDRVRAIIDQAIDRVRTLMPLFERVVFSQDPRLATLGTGIFKPSEEVKKYIFDSLMALNE